MTDEPKYVVSTDNGAICLKTDDRAEAHEYADWLNAQSHEGELLPSGKPYDPGIARVFWLNEDGTMALVVRDDEI